MKTVSSNFCRIEAPSVKEHSSCRTTVSAEDQRPYSSMGKDLKLWCPDAIDPCLDIPAEMAMKRLNLG